MSVYISKQFSSPEEFEAWVVAQEHKNKGFLDNLCEKDKENWDKKACKMTVKDGKLQLLCEDGNVLAETNYYQPDGDTVCCDGENGELRIKGIENTNDPNGKKFRVWVGTQAEYDAIRVKDPKTMYYITDETLLDDILSGAIKVGHAVKADHATEAGRVSTIELKEYSDLSNLILANNGYGTYAVAINDKPITIPNVCTLPYWASGMLIVDTDAALSLTDIDGNITSVYYDASKKNWAVQKLKQKPDEAGSMSTVVIKSYDQLISIIESNSGYGTYAIAINDTKITIEGVGTIPYWTSGLLVVDTDAALTLTTRDGNVISAYYDGVNKAWTAFKTLKQKPDEASHATTADSLKNGATIGRRALFEQRGSSIYSYRYEITQNNQQITIPNIDLKDKFIIFEITIFSGSLYGSGMIGRFRTTPIYETLYTDSYGMNFVIPCAVVMGCSETDYNPEDRMWFDIRDSNTIMVSVENFLGGGETGNRYFLSGIYEEI